MILRYWPQIADNDPAPSIPFHMELFLDTGPEAPFCKFHYLLDIVLADPGRYERGIGESVQGYLKVNLYGDKGELEDYNFTPE